MNEQLNLVGTLQMTLVGPDGLVKEQHDLKNLIVQVGKNYLANAVLNNATTPFTYMALGTSTTAAGLGDTTLGTEIARQAFTTSNVTTNVVTLSTTYNPGVATGAVAEAGIFNASSSGTMLSHVVFSVINKGAADTLTINWTITVG